MSGPTLPLMLLSGCPDLLSGSPAHGLDRASGSQPHAPAHAHAYARTHAPDRLRME